MSFTRYKGKTKTMWLPVTPSTAITKGAIVSFSSGKLIAATSSTAIVSHAGVIKKTIASTDSDYALDRLVPVEVPVEKGVLWLADFTATAAATTVGTEVDLTDSLTVNSGATSIKAVFHAGHISSTKGLVIIKVGGGLY